MLIEKTVSPPQKKEKKKPCLLLFLLYLIVNCSIYITRALLPLRHSSIYAPAHASSLSLPLKKNRKKGRKFLGPNFPAKSKKVQERQITE